MPAYDPNALPIHKPILNPGIPITVWDHETIITSPPSSPEGDLDSMQVSLHRHEHFPVCLSVEIEFSANPGAFQVDVQAADTDDTFHYVTKASLSSGLNSSFIGRIEVTAIVAKFVRLKMVTLTNVVAVTAKIF